MEGRYRIQSVAELTGVPAPTLRAWERRYGVPNPARSASAYRLYSEEDVELIRRLKTLVDDGMAPAEAAQMVLTVEATAAGETTGEEVWSQARTRIVEAVHRFDAVGLRNEVRAALYLGPATLIVDKVLTPALHEVGDLWHDGRLSVAQEHLGTEVLGNAMRDLLRLLLPENPERMVLLGCFADEEHVLPLYAVAFHFVRWGFRPEILGTRLPPEALGYAVERLHPDLIGLSVSTRMQKRRAEELVADYGRAAGKTPWIVGGGAADGLRALIEAHGGLVYSERDFRELRLLVDRAVRETREVG